MVSGFPRRLDHGDSWSQEGASIKEREFRSDERGTHWPEILTALAKLCFAFNMESVLNWFLGRDAILHHIAGFPPPEGNQDNPPAA